MRTTRKWKVAAAALALATVGGLVGVSPAGADDTTTTFTLTAGGLTISVPATSNLGSFPTGSASASGALGTVTVTDARGALVATWTASVSSTSFTTGTATTDETVAASALGYTAGLPTAQTGVGVCAGLPQSNLSTAKPAMNLTVGVGNNSCSWNPTLSATLLSSQVAGTYSGTVTHSVA